MCSKHVFIKFSKDKNNLILKKKKEAGLAYHRKDANKRHGMTLPEILFYSV
jgi:hypothetical protein